ncbi:MAG: DUF2294 family protein [Bacteroidales bacterium]|nr:DUF2294 family protein [Bacteroidales bacterium]
MLEGEFKQKVALYNNKANIDILGQGLEKQRVDFLGNKVIITAKNRRLKSLKVLESFDVLTAKMMEVAMNIRLKEALEATLSKEMGLSIYCIVKDYDKNKELSVTVIILEESIEEILKCL